MYIQWKAVTIFVLVFFKKRKFPIVFIHFIFQPAICYFFIHHLCTILQWTFIIALHMLPSFQQNWIFFLLSQLLKTTYTLGEKLKLLAILPIGVRHLYIWCRSQQMWHRGSAASLFRLRFFFFWLSLPDSKVKTIANKIDAILS